MTDTSVIPYNLKLSRHGRRIITRDFGITCHIVRMIMGWDVNFNVIIRITITEFIIVYQIISRKIAIVRTTAFPITAPPADPKCDRSSLSQNNIKTITMGYGIAFFLPSWCRPSHFS